MFVPCHLATVVPDDDGQRGHENEDRPYPDDVMNLKGSQRGTGCQCELDRSHNAPESECRRRDSRRQEKVTAFIGLQMRLLWW